MQYEFQENGNVQQHGGEDKVILIKKSILHTIYYECMNISFLFNCRGVINEAWITHPVQWVGLLLFL